MYGWRIAFSTWTYDLTFDIRSIHSYLIYSVFSLLAVHFGDINDLNSAKLTVLDNSKNGALTFMT